jgi:hypothetical protein
MADDRTRLSVGDVLWFLSHGAAGDYGEPADEWGQYPIVRLTKTRVYIDNELRRSGYEILNRQELETNGFCMGLYTWAAVLAMPYDRLPREVRQYRDGYSEAIACDAELPPHHLERSAEFIDGWVDGVEARQPGPFLRVPAS